MCALEKVWSRNCFDAGSVLFYLDRSWVLFLFVNSSKLSPDSLSLSVWRCVWECERIWRSVRCKHAGAGNVSFAHILGSGLFSWSDSTQDHHFPVLRKTMAQRSLHSSSSSLTLKKSCSNRQQRKTGKKHSSSWFTRCLVSLILFLFKIKKVYFARIYSISW